MQRAKDTHLPGSTRLRPAIVLAVFAAAILLLSACSDDADQANAVDPVTFAPEGYVATTSELDTFLALVTNGETLRAYLCDGHDGEVSTSDWFEGGVGDDGAVQLRSGRGAELAATVTAERISGSVHVDERTLTFDATPAAGTEGLYEYRANGGAAPAGHTVRSALDAGGMFLTSTSTRGGWVIIIPEGTEEQRGAIAFGNALRAAPPLDTTALTADVPELGEIDVTKVRAGDL